MIPTNLIENALSLTGKTMEDVYEYWEAKDENDRYYNWLPLVFSIEKFCYYLLSPEFIEKYMPLLFPFEITWDYEWYLRHTAKDFWEAIYEYQSWNHEPLISLLEKIWKN